MFPASTHKGLAVSTFPDVCKTPGAPGTPTPVPYSNIGMTRGGKNPGTRKIKSTAKKGVPMLKKELNDLHGTLMGMKPGNTTKWHKALDDYVMKSADVYKALSPQIKG